MKKKRKFKKLKNDVIIEKNIKLNNMNRILNLFDIYGNENVTIINPVKKPGFL